MQHVAPWKKARVCYRKFQADAGKLLVEEVVDRAGQLLTKMIESMELIKSDVYISNIIMKTSNHLGIRPPTQEEI